MIKTVNGNKIEYRTLEQKLEDAVNSENITVNPVKIECFHQKNKLAITVEHQEKNTPDSGKIISIINKVIAEEKIIDKALIYLADSPESLYKLTHNETKEDEDDLDSEEISTIIEIDNTNQEQLDSNPKSTNQYKSKNFSVGFTSFFVGLILVAMGGIIYYFTRPCVVTECKLIPKIQSEVDNSLDSINQDGDAENLKRIQAKISESNQELTRIPKWSKSYDSAQNLIKEYQQKNINLAEILKALELEKNARNISQNLPLSEDEWVRVNSYWQEAINILQSNKDEEFTNLIDSKLNIYQNEIQTNNRRIYLEKESKILLSEAQNMANKITEKQTQINSLTALENAEKDWVTVISKIENISAGTTAFAQKDTLLNDYLEKLLGIREKIKQEKLAENLLAQIKNGINLAKKSEQENQWTKAVSQWENAVKLLAKPPENTFFSQEFEQLNQQTQKELARAKIELKLAIIRENIRTDLKRICNTSDNICNYSVSNELIKVYLTEKYLQNVAKISAQSNQEKQRQLEEHINQVEKNYQYISAKYRKPLEVYNPQKQLIVRYK